MTDPEKVSLMVSLVALAAGGALGLGIVLAMAMTA